MGAIVARLFRAHGTRVRRYLSYRLRSDEDGKDAAQEAFLRLVRREREGALREGSSNSYLFSAAFTVAVDVERDRAAIARYRAVDADSDAIASTEATPEEQLHWRNALAHFVSCLERLDEGPRKVFVMRYFKGMTYSQIAGELDMKMRTIERHVAKALAQLGSDMKDYL
jgi:RNA polymerase sigma-70 factor (ECF subfamily)